MTVQLEKRRLKALNEEIASNNRERKCCGVLHQRMTRFLPDFIDEGEEFVNLRRISIAFEMSYQGVYKWVKPNQPNRITAQVAQTLVDLSKLTENKPDKDWRPATIEDFWEFVIS